MSIFTLENTFECFGDPCLQAFDTLEEAQAALKTAASGLADCLFVDGRRVIANEPVALVPPPAPVGSSTELEWEQALFAKAVAWSEAHGLTVNTEDGVGRELSEAYLPLSQIAAACEDGFVIEPLENADQEEAVEEPGRFDLLGDEIGSDEALHTHGVISNLTCDAAQGQTARIVTYSDSGAERVPSDRKWYVEASRTK